MSFRPPSAAPLPPMARPPSGNSQTPRPPTSGASTARTPRIGLPPESPRPHTSSGPVGMTIAPDPANDAIMSRSAKQFAAPPPPLHSFTKIPINDATMRALTFHAQRVTATTAADSPASGGTSPRNVQQQQLHNRPNSSRSTERRAPEVVVKSPSVQSLSSPMAIGAPPLPLTPSFSQISLLKTGSNGSRGGGNGGGTSPSHRRASTNNSPNPSHLLGPEAASFTMENINSTGSATHNDPIAGAHTVTQKLMELHAAMTKFHVTADIALLNLASTATASSAFGVGISGAEESRQWVQSLAAKDHTREMSTLLTAVVESQHDAVARKDVNPLKGDYLSVTASATRAMHASATVAGSTDGMDSQSSITVNPLAGLTTSLGDNAAATDSSHNELLKRLLAHQLRNAAQQNNNGGAGGGSGDFAKPFGDIELPAEDLKRMSSAASCGSLLELQAAVQETMRNAAQLCQVALKVSQAAWAIANGQGTSPSVAPPPLSPFFVALLERLERLSVRLRTNCLSGLHAVHDAQDQFADLYRSYDRVLDKLHHGKGGSGLGGGGGGGSDTGMFSLAPDHSEPGDDSAHHGGPVTAGGAVAPKTSSSITSPSSALRHDDSSSNRKEYLVAIDIHRAQDMCRELTRDIVDDEIDLVGELIFRTATACGGSILRDQNSGACVKSSQAEWTTSLLPAAGGSSTTPPPNNLNNTAASFRRVNSRHVPTDVQEEMRKKQERFVQAKRKQVNTGWILSFSSLHEAVAWERAMQLLSVGLPWRPETLRSSVGSERLRVLEDGKASSLDAPTTLNYSMSYEAVTALPSVSSPMGAEPHGEGNSSEGNHPGSVGGLNTMSKSPIVQQQIKALQHTETTYNAVFAAVLQATVSRRQRDAVLAKEETPKLDNPTGAMRRLVTSSPAAMMARQDASFDSTADLPSLKQQIGLLLRQYEQRGLRLKSAIHVCDPGQDAMTYRAHSINVPMATVAGLCAMSLPGCCSISQPLANIVAPIVTAASGATQGRGRGESRIGSQPNDPLSNGIAAMRGTRWLGIIPVHWHPQAATNHPDSFLSSVGVDMAYIAAWDRGRLMKPAASNGLLSGARVYCDPPTDAVVSVLGCISDALVRLWQPDLLLQKPIIVAAPDPAIVMAASRRMSLAPGIRSLNSTTLNSTMDTLGPSSRPSSQPTLPWSPVENVFGPSLIQSSRATQVNMGTGDNDSPLGLGAILAARAIGKKWTGSFRKSKAGIASSSEPSSPTRSGAGADGSSGGEVTSPSASGKPTASAGGEKSGGKSKKATAAAAGNEKDKSPGKKPAKGSKSKKSPSPAKRGGDGSGGEDELSQSGTARGNKSMSSLNGSKSTAAHLLASMNMNASLKLSRASLAVPVETTAEIGIQCSDRNWWPFTGGHTNSSSGSGGGGGGTSDDSPDDDDIFIAAEMLKAARGTALNAPPLDRTSGSREGMLVETMGTAPRVLMDVMDELLRLVESSSLWSAAWCTAQPQDATFGKSEPRPVRKEGSTQSMDAFISGVAAMSSLSWLTGGAAGKPTNLPSPHQRSASIASVPKLKASASMSGLDSDERSESATAAALQTATADGRLNAACVESVMGFELPQFPGMWDELATMLLCSSHVRASTLATEGGDPRFDTTGSNAAFGLGLTDPKALRTLQENAAAEATATTDVVPGQLALPPGGSSDPQVLTLCQKIENGQIRTLFEHPGLQRQFIASCVGCVVSTLVDGISERMAVMNQAVLIKMKDANGGGGAHRGSVSGPIPSLSASASRESPRNRGMSSPPKRRRSFKGTTGISSSPLGVSEANAVKTAETVAAQIVIPPPMTALEYQQTPLSRSVKAEANRQRSELAKKLRRALQLTRDK